LFKLEPVTATAAICTAVVFTWLGMVLAISFLEAPLKFRAPGVTVPVGLGIGRLVFRALNTAEIVFAVALVAAVCAGPPATRAIIAGAAVVAALALQIALVRPRLSRRTPRRHRGRRGQDAERRPNARGK
jgi:hypothetical protein